LEKIKKILENLDWSLDIDENYYTLGKYSSAGQDFSIIFEICEENKNDITVFKDKIYECFTSYDISEEASLWLDDSGHGMNGAPYDMKDVYADMQECKDALKTLYLAVLDEC